MGLADVDPEVHRLDGVYVYDLDSLRLLADCTLEARKFEAERCENLVEKYVTEFQAWLNRTGNSTVSPISRMTLVDPSRGELSLQAIAQTGT